MSSRHHHQPLEELLWSLDVVDENENPSTRRDLSEFIKQRPSAAFEGRIDPITRWKLALMTQYNQLIQEFERRQFGLYDDLTDASGGSYTALEFAVTNSLDATTLVLEHMLKLPPTGTIARFMDPALRMAVAYSPVHEKHQIIDLLLKNGASKSPSKGRHSLAIAAVLNDTTTMSQLVHQGANVDELDDQSRTPVSYAAEFGDLPTVAWLIRQRARLDLGINPPLLQAIERLNEEMVASLLQAGADRNYMHEVHFTSTERQRFPGKIIVDPPLVTAAVAGSCSIIRLLCKYGARKDLKNKTGDPALMTAAVKGNREAVFQLLALGADYTKLSYPPAYLGGFEKMLTGNFPELARKLPNLGIKIKFSSISWNWDAPQLAKSIDHIDFKTTVALICSELAEEAVDDTQYVQATTVLEHFHRRWPQWSESLEDFEEIMNGVISGKGDIACNVRAPLLQGAAIIYDRSRLNLVPDPNGQDFQKTLDLIEILDFLCNAIQPLKEVEKQQFYSQSDYHVVEPSRDLTSFADHTTSSDQKIVELCLELSTGKNILKTPKHNCWNKLFGSSIATVDWTFTKDIPFGVGLEIPFDMMIMLAGSEFVLSIDGGIVFVGYQTVLIPVAVENNCAQFHLIVTENGSPHPSTLDLGERFHTEDHTQFEGMRCFLGWCRDARVRLGTKDFPVTVRQSGTESREQTAETEGYSLGISAATPQPIPIRLSGKRDYKYISHRVQYEAETSYTRLVRNSAGLSVLVYDAYQRRAWFVPKLNLLLYMAGVYISGASKSTREAVPSIGLYADIVGHENELMDKGVLVVDGEGEDTVKFRELLLRFNLNISLGMSKLKKSSGHKLYGLELLDVIREPTGRSMKEISLLPSGEKWICLASKADSVFVCGNLGDVIGPAPEQRRHSPACDMLLTGHDYLATTVSCLDRALGGPEGKITATHCWVQSGQPFAKCKHSGTNRTCWGRDDMLQVLESNSTWMKYIFGSIKLWPSKETPRDAAVVFGQLVTGYVKRVVDNWQRLIGNRARFSTSTGS